MTRKHSYRKMAKRTFAALVLLALIDPKRIQDEMNTIDHNSKISGNRFIRLMAALDNAKLMKRDYPNGMYCNPSQYAPYVNEIKAALKINSTQITLF